MPAVMGQPKLENTIVPEGGSPRQNIKLLGRLHQAIVGSELPIKTRERIANQVERYQSDVLDHSKMLERLGTGGGATAERFMKVVDLCREGAFIAGPNADRARKTAQDLMKRPDFLESYLAGAAQKGERANRLKDLQKLLAEAQIV